jgi:Peptidase propeptide and YPEB domain/PepSY-associated TM region
MKPRKTVYLFHRWIGLFVCLQLIAWSAGGLVFSLLDIEAVRGETESSEAPVLIAEIDSIAITPTAARKRALEAGASAENLSKITLRDRGLGLRYELYDLAGAPVCAVDAASGEVVLILSADDAQALALADFVPDATVLQSFLIDESASTGEFRSKRTPAWRIDLDHSKAPHIYIDAVTGEVLARRNRIWRVFDFFWMLHVMDYKNRDNFNHPLLTSASALALLTGATGVWLWGWRAQSRWRRRAARR